MIFFSLLALSSSLGAYDFHIDLRKFPVYYRSGFSPLDIGRLPERGEGDWIYAERFAPGPEPFIVRNMNIPDLPRSLSLHNLPDMNFTFVIPFTLEDEGYDALLEYDGLVPGMYLQWIGDNWEIYLNGRLVNREMYLDTDGNITASRGRKHLSFPLNRSALRKGENILTIHLVGNPLSTVTGFYYLQDYYLGNYIDISRQHNTRMVMGILAVYLFIGLYYLFVFLSRPVDRHNLYFALFSLLMGIYLSTRSDIWADYVENLHLVSMLEYLTVMLPAPLFACYAERLCQARVGLPARISLGFFLLMGILSVLVPQPIAELILRLWQICIIPLVLYIIIYDVIYKYILAVRQRLKTLRSQGEEPSVALEMWRTMLIAPVGNLILGSLVLGLSVLYDVYDTLVSHQGVGVIWYGFFGFMVLNTYFMVRRIGGLYQLLGVNHQELEEAHQSLVKANGSLQEINDILEQKNRALSQANSRISLNEKRYRSLFEGSREPLAVLDSRFRFKQANERAMEYFDLPDLSPGVDLLASLTKAAPTLADRLFQGDPQREALLERFWDSTYALKLNRAAVNIDAFCLSRSGKKQFCTLHLEYLVSIDMGFEYLLRVIPLDTTGLTEALVEVQAVFEVQNTLIDAEEVCHRISLPLIRYTSLERMHQIEVALREMVINGIVHGNLELEGEEARRLSQAPDYPEQIAERSQLGRYKDRRVRVEYGISASGLRFVVRDQGEGFNYRAFTDREIPETGKLTGIDKARSVFDQVAFVGKGNEVILESLFRSRGPAVSGPGGKR